MTDNNQTALSELIRKYPNSSIQNLFKIISSGLMTIGWFSPNAALFTASGIGLAGIDLMLCKIAYNRTKTFFDEIEKHQLIITDEIMQNENFIHCFWITYNAVLRTRREEKIRYFARLLSGSLTDDKYKDIDEYEELLQILDELTYKEISFLIEVSDFDTHISMKDSENSNKQSDWFTLLNPTLKKYSMTRNDITRIERTGCIFIWFPTRFEKTYFDGHFELTSKFMQLKKLIFNIN